MEQMNYRVILTLILSRSGNRHVGHITAHTVITQVTLYRPTEAEPRGSDVGFNEVLIFLKAVWIPGFCCIDEFEEVFKIFWGT